MERTLDLEIADKIFGMHLIYGPDSKYGNGAFIIGRKARDRFMLPFYSTKMDDAWKILEFFQKNLPTVWKLENEIGWACSFQVPTIIEECGETASTAICLAALKLIPKLGI